MYLWNTCLATLAAERQQHQRDTNPCPHGAYILQNKPPDLSIDRDWVLTLCQVWTDVRDKDVHGRIPILGELMVHGGPGPTDTQPPLRWGQEAESRHELQRTPGPKSIPPQATALPQPLPPRQISFPATGLVCKRPGPASFPECWQPTASPCWAQCRGIKCN